MELAAIMEALKENRDRKFPRRAVEQAIAQKEEITPLLLKALVDAKANIEAIAANETYMLHIYALYLLTQFKEQKAYPLIVDLFSMADQTVIDSFGDLVTEDLGRMFASVCHGDLSLLKQVIENSHIDETVKVEGLTALVTLVVEKVISRDSVLDYFQQTLESIEEKESYLGSFLVMYSLDLYPNAENIPTLRSAFERGIVDPMWTTISELEKVLKNENLETNLEQLQNRHHHHFIEDTIDEMYWWECFKGNAPKKQARSVQGIGGLSGFASSKKSETKRKKKRQTQKQARKQNRSKKKR